METWDAIMARRNVRAFADRPISQADLERVLQAGWSAPSAHNRQHRDFVVCTDRAELEALAQVWQWATHRYATWTGGPSTKLCTEAIGDEAPGASGAEDG